MNHNVNGRPIYGRHLDAEGRCHCHCRQCFITDVTGQDKSNRAACICPECNGQCGIHQKVAS